MIRMTFTNAMKPLLFIEPLHGLDQDFRPYTSDCYICIIPSKDCTRDIGILSWTYQEKSSIDGLCEFVAKNAVSIWVILSGTTGSTLSDNLSDEQQKNLHVVSFIDSDRFIVPSDQWCPEYNGRPLEPFCFSTVLHLT